MKLKYKKLEKAMLRYILINLLKASDKEKNLKSNQRE